MLVTLLSLVLLTTLPRPSSDGSSRSVSDSPTAQCAAAEERPDSDGDGFSDADETAGYLDLDANGRYDEGVDVRFPRRRRFAFSAVAHSGSSTGVVRPTVTRPDRRLRRMEVAITIVTSGTLGTAAFSCRVNGAPCGSAHTVRQFVDLPGNLRLVFGDSAAATFVAGDVYGFSAGQEPESPSADPARPNIYVAYDFMGWAEPGAPCASDDECTAAGRPNEVCHQGACNHSHAPLDPLFREVVESFAEQGVVLDVDPRPRQVPHAPVVTFSHPDDGSNGAFAACAGADVVPGFIGPGAGAVNFHDVKRRPGSRFARRPGLHALAHYAVFGHFNTCFTDVGPVGNCLSCPPDRSTPDGFPVVLSAGTAELPGNDFIVSLGSLYQASGSPPRTLFMEGGVFMHELGHNLGLHHSGDVPWPDGMPNYLSVMNAKYSFTGIRAADAAGSTVANPSLRRIDFSRTALAPLDESSLDERAGVSPLDSGATEIVRFFDQAGRPRSGPAAGPVDWNGNGVIDETPVQGVDLNLDDGGWPNGVTVQHGFADWDHGTCASGDDCRINMIRTGVNGGVPTRESCVQGRCRALIYEFQCVPWGIADAPAAGALAREPGRER